MLLSKLQFSWVSSDEKIDDFIFLDVAPLSLGIETPDGVMTTLVKRNTTIPTTKREIFDFTHFKNGPDSAIYVYEGEHARTKDNNLLGKLAVTEILPSTQNAPDTPVKGLPVNLEAAPVSLEIAFALDANHVLTVIAKEMTTGKSTKITIPKNGRLSGVEIARMIDDAKKYKEDDEKEEHRITARNLAESCAFSFKEKIETAQAAISEMISWLDENETATKEEFEAKQKEFETDITKLFLGQENYLR